MGCIVSLDLLSRRVSQRRPADRVVIRALFGEPELQKRFDVNPRTLGKSDHEYRERLTARMKWVMLPSSAAVGGVARYG